MLDWFEQLSINYACFPAGSPVSLGQIGALPGRGKERKGREKKRKGKEKERGEEEKEEEKEKKKRGRKRKRRYFITRILLTDTGKPH